MSQSFSARIDGRQIRCLIGADRALTAPVLCFSLMAPPAVVSGGTLLRRVAGYAEVALPDLAAGAVHEVVLEHAADLLGLPHPPAIRFEDAALPPMARSFYEESRRVRNDRIKTELGITLLYPTWREGLAEILAAEETLTIGA